MSMKLVMVIDRELPLGLIANTAAVFGMSLGERIPGLVGPPVTDGSGRVHGGITQVSIPILQANRPDLNELRERLFDPEYAAVTVFDFCSAAQQSKAYSDYIRRMAECPAADLSYLGVCLYGPAEQVGRLTGSMKLLR